jgi:hypothetical protein
MLSDPRVELASCWKSTPRRRPQGPQFPISQRLSPISWPRCLSGVDIVREWCGILGCLVGDCKSPHLPVWLTRDLSGFCSA